MPRPHTILLLLDTVALRVDLAWRRGRAHATEVRRRDRGDTDLADAVDALLAGERCRGPVLVLSDEVFLQTLDLPAKAIAGLRGHELAQALAYEAQGYSGFTGDTAVDWLAEGNGRTFLVAQLASADFVAVADGVERSGGRLLGVVHPAGLPAALGEGRRAFARSEDWGSLRAMVRAGDDGIASVRAVRSGRTEAEPERVDEHLVVRSGVPSLPEAQRFELGDPEVMLGWLERWAEAVARDRAVAMLVPPESPAARNRRLLWAALLAALVVGACLFDRVRVQGEVHAATRELAEARAPLDRLVAAEAEAATLARQLEELKQAPAVVAVPGTPWSQRALLVMLDRLAALRPDAVVLDDLSLGWRRCLVRGRTAEAARIDTWASALAQPLAELGYVVVPVDRRQQTADEGGLFEFTLEFQPVPAPPTPVQPTEAGR